MMLGPHFHAAVLVDDLERAVDGYRTLLGHQFNEPSTLAIDTRTADGGGERLDLRVAYSRTGPPYLELVEATGDGLFGARHGAGLHHLGFWAPSELDSEEWPASTGVEIDTEVVGSTGAVFARFTAPRDLDGVRLELIDSARRPGLERWFAGGGHPGHD